MTLYSLPDITGDGSTHSISANSGAQAKWVQLLADPANSDTPIRISGADCSDTQGFPLAAGASFLCPQDHADVTSFYPIREIFYNAANGDKLYILYGAG